MDRLDRLFRLPRRFLQYSGIIAIGVMSIGIILSSRPAFIDKTLGGLDRAYRLHKWLGITALIFVLVHWALKEGKLWLIDLGLLSTPIKKLYPEETQLLFKFFQDNHGLAKDIGEWGFYAFLIFIALALIKKVPYRIFVKTHRLLAIIYLALVFHTACLLKFDYWQQPFIFIMLPLMLAGSIAALTSLFHRTGKSRRSTATITALNYHKLNRVLELDIQLKGAWPGHQPGQFAFLTFDKAEGPHPFTIASAWKNDGNIEFLIKDLGDYTRQLPTLLNTNDLLNIEGPYGRFNFTSDKTHHIWVAGGIGISPFIARMKALANKNMPNDTDLFYCTSEPDETFIHEVSTLAETLM